MTSRRSWKVLGRRGAMTLLGVALYVACGGQTETPTQADAGEPRPRPPWGVGTPRDAGALSQDASSGTTDAAVRASCAAPGPKEVCPLPSSSASWGPGECYALISEYEQSQPGLFAQMNVKFRPLGYDDDSGIGDAYLSFVSSEDRCTEVPWGWYFDQPTAPKAAVPCPAVCDCLKDKAVVELHVGCPRLDAPGNVYPDAALDASQPPDAAIVDGGVFEASAPKSVLQASMGSYHSCAIATDQSLWCWGYNYMGQLGNMSSQSIFEQPTPVPGIGPVKDVCLGFNYSCAVTTGGTLYCWGQNTLGQLGTGPSGSNVPWPDKVYLDDVTDVACGIHHTCALTAKGSVYCWGGNANGQVTTSGVQVYEQPVLVPVSGIVELDLGNDYSCGRKADGSIWCWGVPLGKPTPTPNISQPPTQIPTQNPATALSAGTSHACFLDTAGKVYCWGYGAGGALGQGDEQDSPTPLEVIGGVKSLASKGSTCVVLQDGTTRCWGGHGTFPAMPPQNLTPSDVLGVSSAQTFALGISHGCLIDTLDHISCWGLCWYGQCGNGTKTLNAPLGSVVW